MLQVTKFRPRIPVPKKAGHLDIIEHVKDPTPPDSMLEYNIVDNWDEYDPYSCVTCKLPFDSMLGRLP